jgi:hypothetical protein
MTRLTATALAGAIAISAAMVPAQSYAGGGDVAAGVIGGLAVGAMIGAAASQPRYAPPPPVYYAPAPVYAAPPPCYWTRGEPVWDGMRGTWVRPRVRVCQ